MVTLPRLKYQAIDALAAVTLCVRRRLGTVMPVQPTDVNTGVLRGEVIQGSAYAAFLLASVLRPKDLPELLNVVGYGDLGRSGDEKAFNACVDGYAVYDDGRRRGKLP